MLSFFYSGCHVLNKFFRVKGFNHVAESSFPAELVIHRLNDQIRDKACDHTHDDAAENIGWIMHHQIVPGSAEGDHKQEHKPASFLFNKEEMIKEYNSIVVTFDSIERHKISSTVKSIINAYLSKLEARGIKPIEDFDIQISNAIKSLVK